MNKILKFIFWFLVLFFSCSLVFAAWWNAWWNWSVWTNQWRYENDINDSLSTWLKITLDPMEANDPQWWWQTVVNFVFKMLDKIVIPLIISIWVLIWMIWAYKLLFSSDEKQSSVWLKMVVYWVIGIVVMVSAKYIWSVLFEDIFKFWAVQAISWIELSKDLYDKIAYPFIKIVLYLALAVIFVILVWKSISLITKSSDWSSQKKALWIIWRCAVAMLIIIWAKNIVEAIYWKQEEVFRTATNLWTIWSWILADKNIPIVYNVITWALYIVSFVIFLLLLIQWFKILISPSKSENFQKLWKTLIYTLIWLFVIWVWYLLTNVFILN